MADTTALAAVLETAEAQALGLDALADRARLLELVAAQPLTVGAALADARVQAGSIMEYSAKHDGGSWRQTRVITPGGRVESRWWNRGWCPWRSDINGSVDGADATKPCRIVPVAEADADPATRGAL